MLILKASLRISQKKTFILLTNPSIFTAFFFHCITSICIFCAYFLDGLMVKMGRGLRHMQTHAGLFNHLSSHPPLSPNHKEDCSSWLTDSHGCLTHTNVMLAKWSADPHGHRSRLVRVTLSTEWATLEPALCRRKSKNSDGRRCDIDRDRRREKSLCHVVCIWL